jgi:hypothetical protein
MTKNRDVRLVVLRFPPSDKWSVCYYSRVRYIQVESRNSLAVPGTRNLVTIYTNMHNFTYMINTMTETSGGQLANRCNSDIFPSIYHRQKIQP